MLVLDERLSVINRTIAELERKYDKYEVQPKEYDRLHKQLLERKSKIIQKYIEGGKNV